MAISNCVQQKMASRRNLTGSWYLTLRKLIYFTQYILTAYYSNSPIIMRLSYALDQFFRSRPHIKLFQNNVQKHVANSTAYHIASWENQATGDALEIKTSEPSTLKMTSLLNSSETVPCRNENSSIFKPRNFIRWRAPLHRPQRRSKCHNESWRRKWSKNFTCNVSLLSQVWTHGPKCRLTMKFLFQEWRRHVRRNVDS